MIAWQTQPVLSISALPQRLWYPRTKAYYIFIVDFSTIHWVTIHMEGQGHNKVYNTINNKISRQHHNILRINIAGVTIHSVKILPVFISGVTIPCVNISMVTILYVWILPASQYTVCKYCRRHNTQCFNIAGVTIHCVNIVRVTIHCVNIVRVTIHCVNIAGVTIHSV